MHLYSTDLMRQLATKHRRSQAHYRAALTEITAAITEQLARGHHLTLVGFGTFYTRMQPAGTVSHIRTRKPITVPAHRVAAFRAGEGLKSAARKKVASKKTAPTKTARKGKKK